MSNPRVKYPDIYILQDFLVPRSLLISCRALGMTRRDRWLKISSSRGHSLIRYYTTDHLTCCDSEIAMIDIYYFAVIKFHKFDRVACFSESN